jgi:hypothetical protein
MRLNHILAIAVVPLAACFCTNIAAGIDKANVFANCFCNDAVGVKLCISLKQKLALSGYRLADQPQGAGVGVHLACRDTDVPAKGAQSAVSVAYTVYFNSSNEVFVGVAVTVVGAHSVDSATAAIMSTVGRIVSDNASILRVPEKRRPRSSEEPQG